MFFLHSDNKMDGNFTRLNDSILRDKFLFNFTTKINEEKTLLLLLVIIVHLIPVWYILHVFRRRTVAERLEDVQFAIRNSSLLKYLENNQSKFATRGRQNSVAAYSQDSR